MNYEAGGKEGDSWIEAAVVDGDRTGTGLERNAETAGQSRSSESATPRPSFAAILAPMTVERGYVQAP